MTFDTTKLVVCTLGSVASVGFFTTWWFFFSKGWDESERRRAESQWIVAARPLCHLQYPVTYLSRLQRILPVA